MKELMETNRRKVGRIEEEFQNERAKYTAELADKERESVLLLMPAPNCKHWTVN